MRNYGIKAARHDRWEKLGDCTTPDGKSGDWRITTFEVPDDIHTQMMNMRYIRDNQAYAVVNPGTYKKLTHKTRGVIMSNTPMEVHTNQIAYEKAQGHVLIMGLGMGMILEALLHKPEVASVKVLELEPDVMALTEPHMRKVAKANNKALMVLHRDATTYKPIRGERYDYIWHDIWDNFDDENLSTMRMLSRRFAGRSCYGQDHWSRPQLLAERRREARYGRPW